MRLLTFENEPGYESLKTGFSNFDNMLGHAANVANEEFRKTDSNEVIRS